MAKKRRRAKPSSAKPGPSAKPRPQATQRPPAGADVLDRAEVAADAPLPLLHRLAIGYLMLPIGIWLVGWFEWWFGVPATVLLGASMLALFAGPWRIKMPRSLAPLALVLLAFGWTMLTAAGGVFDGNNIDWIDHRTLLMDLSRHPWPTYPPDDLADHLQSANPPALLRYYFGWYMVPALAGRLFGPAALAWAVPLWTGLGVTLALLLFARRLQGWRMLLGAGIFVFFSGMDVLRVALVDGIEILAPRLDALGWPGISLGVDHIEWLGFWGVFHHQSTGHMSALMWVPHHLISAALYVLLLLHLCRNRRFLGASGVLFAAAPFWSAFVALGLLPLLGVVIWRNGLRPFLRWPNLCVAAPLVGLIVAYLTAGSVDFPQGWLWEQYSWSLLAKSLPTFYFSEFLPVALLTLALRPALGREPFFVVSLALLLLLPVYTFSKHNDLYMRGSMPLLLLLCYYCMDVLVGPGDRRLASGTAVRFARAGLIAVLAIGALNACVELVRATRDDILFRYESAGLTTFASPATWQRENLALDIPQLLAWPLRPPALPAAAETPAATAPIVQARFNVYRKDKKLVYVKEQCSPNTDETIRVWFVPENLDTNAGTGWLYKTRQVGKSCGTVVGFPGYPFSVVKTGQLPEDGGHWVEHIRFDAEGG